MKALVALGLSLFVCGLSTAAAQPSPDAEARKLLERFSGEPSINEVQQAAVQYAQIHPEIFSGLRSRTRWSATLPELKVQVDRGMQDVGREVQRINETTREYENQSLTTEDDDDLSLLLEARWKLQQLVFNPSEMRAVTENRQASKERHRLLQAVTRSYFERRRAQVDLILSPPGDVAARTMAELKIAELTAELDGLTGGAFSRLAAER